MARRVRYHENFRTDLAVRVRWLRANRPAEQQASLRTALASFARRIVRFPALGREIERRGTVSYRARPIGDPLPYIVWYSYDTADESAPVSLLMLLHEAQDREGFDPDRFET